MTLRVLHVLLEPRMGGPQLRILALAQSLRAHAIETVVVLPTGPAPFKSYLETHGFEVVQVPLHRFRWSLSPTSQLRTTAALPGDIHRLRGLMQNIHPDLVHIHGLYQPQGALAARTLGLPIAWHLNDLLLPVPMARLAAVALLNLSDAAITVSNAVRKYLFGDVRAAYSRARNPAFRNGHTHALPNPRAYLRVFPKYFRPSSLFHAHWKKIVTIYDPPVRVVGSTIAHTLPARGTEQRSDLAAWDAIVRQDPDSRPPLLLTVGNLYRIKGHADLLRALAQLEAPLALAVVGAQLDSQPEVSLELRQLRTALGLENRVFFLGWQENVADFMAQCDIYVHPSHSEACPLAILEAMASGKPVLATAVGGVPELVIQNHSGLLVPAHSPAALARGLRSILAQRSRWAIYGAAGRRLMQNQFSLNRCADRHAALYRALVSGQPPNIALEVLDEGKI